MRVVILGMAACDPRPELIEAAVRASGFDVTDVLGGGRGGMESAAIWWSKRAGVPFEREAAVSRGGKPGWPGRNARLAARGDALIAFPMIVDRSTNDAIRRFREAGKPVFVQRIRVDVEPPGEWTDEQWEMAKAVESARKPPREKKPPRKTARQAILAAIGEEWIPRKTLVAAVVAGGMKNAETLASRSLSGMVRTGVLERRRKGRGSEFRRGSVQPRGVAAPPTPVRPAVEEVSPPCPKGCGHGLWAHSTAGCEDCKCAVEFNSEVE